MCKSKKKCACSVYKRISMAEGIKPPKSMSIDLQHHINANKPLNTTQHRVGSAKHKQLFVEARKLYSRGLLEVKDPIDLKYLKDKNYGYRKDNVHVLDIEGNKVKDIPTDGDTRRTPTRRGDMDDEWGDLPPVPRGDMMESRIRKIVRNLGR